MAILTAHARTLLKLLRKLALRVRAQLLPASCVLCAALTGSARALCSACAAELPWLDCVCRVCAIPLTARAAEGEVSCGACLRRAPPFARTLALFHYATPIAEFIGALKFQQQLLYAQLFGELLSQQVQARYRDSALPELIIPMPLHRRRLRARGFNQALEIARPVAQFLQLPIDAFSCERVRATTAQSLLSAEQRQQNLRQAFKLKAPLQANYVAIIDDVITTGCTVTELAKTLRRAGVQRVDVWSIARTDLIS